MKKMQRKLSKVRLILVLFLLTAVSLGILSYIVTSGRMTDNIYRDR